MRTIDKRANSFSIKVDKIGPVTSTEVSTDTKNIESVIVTTTINSPALVVTNNDDTYSISTLSDTPCTYNILIVGHN